MKSYEYICDQCGYIMEIEVGYGEAPPKEVICPHDGNLMRRNWQTAIVIPAYMKAGVEGDAHTTITQKMKHANRPSGRKKVHY